MAEPSTQPPSPELSGSAVFVPQSLQEREKIAVELKKAAFEAHAAKDRPELRRRQLKEMQFLTSCTIHDLQHPTASSPLPPQVAASPQLLRGLQADLAYLNDQLEQLERDELVPASPTVEERQG